MLGFLWGREQTGLMREMIDAGLSAIIIKVAALGQISQFFFHFFQYFSIYFFQKITYTTLF